MIFTSTTTVCVCLWDKFFIFSLLRFLNGGGFRKCYPLFPPIPTMFTFFLLEERVVLVKNSTQTGRDFLN